MLRGVEAVKLGVVLTTGAKEDRKVFGGASKAISNVQVGRDFLGGIAIRFCEVNSK